MMNKLTNIVCLLATVFVVACTKDYVEPEFKIKTFGVYASFFAHGQGGPNVNPTYQQTFKLEAMMDISQGFQSHEWSFWKDQKGGEGDPVWIKMDDGVKFIKKNADLGWGSIPDYTPYLDLSLQPTNNQDNLVFYFEKGGRYSVKIKNVYDTQIEYMIHETDPVFNDNVNTYHKAELMESGKYLVERDYVFELYDTLAIDFRVYEDEECRMEVDLESVFKRDSILTVQQGKVLYFKDATGTTKYNSGTSRQWSWSYYSAIDEIPPTSFPSVEPSISTDPVAKFTFTDKGHFRVNLTVKRDENPEIPKLPITQKSEVLPLKIKVE